MRLLLLSVLLILMVGCQAREPVRQPETRPQPVVEAVALPAPAFIGERSLEAALAGRISHRTFADRPLTKEALAQMLWAMQGEAVDARTGATRTAPSAGATHPLTVYVVVRNVAGVESGIYVYLQHNHSLRLRQHGEFAAQLTAAALNQDSIAQAPVNFVLVAEYARTTGRYGERGRRYVYMEVGHATQNLLLQAEVLGLDTVAIGAFHDDRVAAVLGTQLAPLMIVPTGFAR